MSESTIDKVIANYLEAIEAGEQPERERLMGNHSHLADQLREFFNDLDGIQQFVSEDSEDNHSSAVDLVSFSRLLNSQNQGRLQRLLKQRKLEAQYVSTQSGAESTKHDSSRKIGPYKLLQQIGAGGMGEVWMAEQVKPVRRRVALKLIKAGMDSKQVIARFEAERQALAMMDHQHIAKVLDAGTTETGSPYFVMEMVQGIPITKYCDKNKLSIRQRLELFVPICQAVQHAHQKGIIHRDLKPSNILVTLYDGRPVPKVIDFGLAKALQHQSQLTDKTLFTEFGQVVGTLQYMSPEQAEMNALDVDTRTDIYSLGAMLYETLTGSTPIERETLEKEAVLKVLETIREQDPPRPSSRLSASGDAITGISQQRQIDPRKLTQILRGDLDWIVMKTLEKDRTRRYATANDFSADVQRYLNGEAVEARPPSTGYRARKFILRNRRLVTAAVAFTTLLLAGITASTWFGIAANVARNDAIIEKNRAEDERRRAESANEAMVDAMARAESARIRAERGETQAMMELLSHYHTSADSKLARARQLLAEGGVQDSHEKAAMELSEAGLFRNKASTTLAKLGSQADQIKQDEQQTWSQRMVQLRNEASRVVTDTKSQRIRTIGLGTVERYGWDAATPAAVMTPDRKTILTFTGGERIVVLEVEGGIARSIPLPRHEKSESNTSRPAMALSPDGRWLAVARPTDSSVTEILVMSLDGKSHRWLTLPERAYFGHDDPLPYIAFPDNDIVEYESYSWTLSTGEVTNSPSSLPTKPANRVRLTSGDGRLEATWERWSQSTGSLIVRRVADGASIAVVPHANATNVDPPLMLFSDDLKSLFLALGDTLISVDLLTGNSVRSKVREAASTASKISIRRLLPWQKGVITVESLEGESATWQLSYWATVFPGNPVHTIGSPQPVSCLANSNDLVVTGSDNTVRAWRNGELLWASGSGMPESIESQSYPWWEFASRDRQYFLLERQKLLPGGKTGIVTELYTPDGKLIHAFPVEGEGRLIATRLDRQRAVIVAGVGQEKQELVLYSLTENHSLASLGEHRNDDSVVTFSPDGKWLLIQSKSRLEIEVWDVTELKHIGRFKPRFDAFDITFVPGQPWLITTSRGGSENVEADLFDLQTASRMCELQDFNTRVFKWHASERSAGLLGIWGERSGRLRVTSWDINSGKTKLIELGNYPWQLSAFYLFLNVEQWTLDQGVGDLLTLFSADGTRLFVAGGDSGSLRGSRVQLWDLDQESLLRSSSLNDSYFNRFSVSHYGDAETINLHIRSILEHHISWNWSDGQDSSNAAGLEQGNQLVASDSEGETQIRLSADALLLYRSGVEGPIVLADTATDARGIADFQKSGAGITVHVQKISLAPNGAPALFLPGFPPGLWNPDTGKTIVRFKRGTNFRGFDVSGRWIVTSDDLQRITIWDTLSGEPQYAFTLPEKLSQFELKLHPGGRFVAVQSQGTLSFFDAASGRELATIEKPGHVGPVRCLADSQEAGLVASAGVEGVVLLWDRETGQLRNNLRLNMPGISQLAFRPDGKRLAAITIEKDSDRGHEALAMIDLQGSTDWVIDTTHHISQPSVFAFHPSGEFLVVGSMDGEVLFVNAFTGDVIGLYRGEQTRITSLAFSTDGGYLATANESGNVHLWNNKSLGPITSWANGSAVSDMKFLGGGRVLVTAGREIRLHDISSNAEILRFRLSDQPAHSIGYRRSARELVCHDVSGGVVSVDLDKLEQFFQELNLGSSSIATLTSSKVVANESSWDSVLEEYRHELREQWLQQDLDVLAESLLDAKPKEFETLFSQFAAHGDQARKKLHHELDRKLTVDWKDKPLDPSWSAPTPEVKRKIELAGGVLADRFAFCQTMSLDEFKSVTEELGKSGFRPSRLRPYAHHDSVQVAAAWIRDGVQWRLSTGQSAEAIEQQDQEHREAGMIPVDVAGYIVKSDAGAAEQQYAALWKQKGNSSLAEDARLYAGASYAEHKAVYGAIEKEGFSRQQSLQGFRGLDGQQRYCGVRSQGSGSGTFSWQQLEVSLESKEYLDKIHWDIDPSNSPDILNTHDRYSKALAEAEVKLTSEPNETRSRYARGEAYFYLGDDKRAIEDFDFLVEENEADPRYYRYRAVLHARLRNTEEARADLIKFSERNKSANSKAYLDMVVAAYLGDEIGGMKRLEELIEISGESTGSLYDAACACAICSEVFGEDAAKSKEFADNAVAFLQRAVANGYNNYSHMQRDPDLDPIRGRAEFVEIMSSVNLDVRYASVWNSSTKSEAMESHGLSVTEHLAECKQFAEQGYRIASISTASIGGELVTASAWHRPIVADSEKESLARRQANAAIAAFRMGDTDTTWRQLEDSPNPRLGSWIIHQSELMRVSSDQLTERIAQQSSPSIRRSMVLILGMQPNIAQVDQQKLSPTLQDLYRFDRDAGVRGAAEWVLRKWGKDTELAKIDAEFAANVIPGDRGWYRTTQGQQMVVISTPGEFLMGSPPTEAYRRSNENLHRKRIDRSFCISSKEVTIGQFQQFLDKNSTVVHSYENRHAPDESCPQTSVTWYEAAAYCRWLSVQEGIPESQMCYPPISKIKEGMTMPRDYLSRTGYRLPTEAEWEYACRARSATSRYYGESVDLLPHHARTADTRTLPTGSLIPNRFGLFDMLGNVSEWCQERYLRYDSDRDSLEDREDNATVNDSESRMLRGAAYATHQSSRVRSAKRDSAPPHERTSSNGFRLARTHVSAP